MWLVCRLLSFGASDLGESEGKHRADTRRRSRVGQQPEDARKSTEEQRKMQEQLEHQDDDPDAPGLHQSHRNVPDESTR